MAVVLKSDREIELIRQGGRILAEVLQKLVERIRPGLSTAEIDRFAREEFDRRVCVRRFWATAAFLRPSACR